MRPPALPLGTQVVLREAGIDRAGQALRAGATGRVIELLPGGDYVIGFPDGRSGVAGRGQLSLRTGYQQQIAIGDDDEATARHRAARLVTEHTIFAAVVGSRAFGLATESSDTDTRGVYLAPTAEYWSFRKPPPHVEGPEPEWFSWEVERFCELALKANPSLLELLHSPLVVRCTDLGRELLDLREAFLSQLAYQTFSGYVLSQFGKLEADFRVHGAPKWKHVTHLLRLLLSGRDLLRSGHLDPDVGVHRERLIAIRNGEQSWDDVERWRLQLHAELDRALAASPLPERPDVHRVERWLHSARLRSVRDYLAETQPVGEYRQPTGAFADREPDPDNQHPDLTRESSSRDRS